MKPREIISGGNCRPCLGVAVPILSCCTWHRISYSPCENISGDKLLWSGMKLPMQLTIFNDVCKVNIYFYLPFATTVDIQYLNLSYCWLAWHIYTRSQGSSTYQQKTHPCTQTRTENMMSAAVNVTPTRHQVHPIWMNYNGHLSYDCIRLIQLTDF